MTRHLTILLLTAFLSAPALLARDIYVDCDQGSDSASGLAAKPEAGGAGPVKTIAKAVAMAQAGDTVHLAPRAEPYHESVELRNRSGESGKPIVVDGHGATITGVDSLKPEDWTQAEPGLYRSDTLFGTLKGDNALLDRIFFIFNGHMQHMDRTSKGPKAAFKPAKDLQPGQWTFEESSKAFYLRIEPGQSLADARVEIPMRNSGVKISGVRNEHLVIRNITATHFWNDGFNIHNQSADLRFENIRAIENGDDGISAHEACEFELDGFVALRNSTGVCNIQQARCKLRNLYLAQNLGVEFFALESTNYDVANVIIDASAAARPMAIMGHPKTSQICTVNMDNVLIFSASPGKRAVEVTANGTLKATRLTSVNLPWRVQGKVSLASSIIAPAAVSVECTPRSTWEGSGNVYDLRRLFVAGKAYSAGSFADYQQVSGQDKDSRWRPLEPPQLTDFLRGIAKPANGAGANVQLKDAQVIVGVDNH